METGKIAINPGRVYYKPAKQRLLEVVPHILERHIPVSELRKDAKSWENRSRLEPRSGSWSSLGYQAVWRMKYVLCGRLYWVQCLRAGLFQAVSSVPSSKNGFHQNELEIVVHSTHVHHQGQCGSG